MNFQMPHPKPTETTWRQSWRGGECKLLFKKTKLCGTSGPSPSAIALKPSNVSRGKQGEELHLKCSWMINISGDKLMFSSDAFISYSSICMSYFDVNGIFFLQCSPKHKNTFKKIKLNFYSVVENLDSHLGNFLISKLEGVKSKALNYFVHEMLQS